MTRVVVHRGSASSSSSSSTSSSSSSSSSPSPSASTSSSSQNRASPTTSSPSPLQHVSRIAPVVPVNDGYLAEDQELVIIEESSELCDATNDKLEGKKNEVENLVTEDGYCKHEKSVDGVKFHDVDDGVGPPPNDFGGSKSFLLKENDALVVRPSKMATGSSCPPPPPLPPPKPTVSPRRLSPPSGSSNAVRSGPSRLSSGWPGMSNRSSPTGSRPSSPRSHSEVEGYNSADEQNPCFTSTYDDAAREHRFEAELGRVKGLEVRKMMEDGNCLFRAVADLVYGDSELYDLVRQMCIDYMERERDHFSQFVTEGFTSYCKRKRRDKVYGNNVEIQALSEMYNRPIHIYSYSTEPINILHGSYNTDTPPIRLSYHHGNHYNSLVDPRRLDIGAGLGFNSLQGTNVGRDQVKAAIKAQQDQQIENALVAEGRFYSDLELTEKEIERMVLEDSRKEYLAGANKFNRDSSSSQAEPSSSAARPSSESGESVANNISMQIMLSMGFSYLQVVEAYSIFGDDVDSMVSYLIETSNRRKGKATE